MMQWQRWMTETWQRGGRLVFLREDLPKATEQFPGVVLISASEVIKKTCVTNAEDLIFIFECQFATLQKLDACLQGQRVLVGNAQEAWLKTGWVDAVIPDLDSAQWREAFMQLADTKAPELQQPLADFKTGDGRPCLFLDRDDVVVKNIPYNKDPQQVVLTAGIIELIHQAHAENWWVALVTNQSGLGRARITWGEFQTVHQQMLKLLAAQGAWIDESVWACHIENASHPAGEFYAGLRKPRAGMFQQVDKKLRVHRAASIMVGDSASDIFAAYHAGIGQIILLQTEKTDAEIVKIEQARAHLPGLRYQIVKELSAIQIPSRPRG